MFFHEKNGSVIFYLQVVPNAAQTCIVGVVAKYDKMAFKLHSKEPPERGKANKEIIEYLSSLLDMPKSHVVIDKGETEKFKKIKVLNAKQVDVQKAFQGLGFL
ncbi:MAG: DUF167 domain-containing protein [Alphaproteobacteria bacterium]|nr:MAG: DUF167 domain-containing protein [Alphaproteobacteria bacterium]